MADIIKSVRFFLKIVIIVTLIIITSCSKGNLITSTATHIKVLGKKHSEDYSEYWIVASYANVANSSETIDIYIEEPMLWNLIQENQEYFVMIITEEGKKAELGQISYPGDENAAR